MKVNLNELRQVIQDILAEAKKKKEKAEKAKYTPKPSLYGYAEALDFSAPLGAYNLYRNQGAVNWGPMTGPGTAVDNRFHSVNPLAEDLKEAAENDPWRFLSEVLDPVATEGIWESVQDWYDHGIEEKKVGFKKLSKKLSHQKGVTDPDALAAHIGRQKYGKVGMAKKAAAGRK